jgi:hypothetical protein
MKKTGLRLAWAPGRSSSFRSDGLDNEVRPSTINIDTYAQSFLSLQGYLPPPSFHSKPTVCSYQKCPRFFRLEIIPSASRQRLKHITSGPSKIIQTRSAFFLEMSILDQSLHSTISTRLTNTTSRSMGDRSTRRRAARFALNAPKSMSIRSGNSLPRAMGDTRSKAILEQKLAGILRRFRHRIWMGFFPSRLFTHVHIVPLNVRVPR